ncbi:MAG: fimbrillin family protein [Candidatus Cryptobacteroides sp.]
MKLLKLITTTVLTAGLLLLGAACQPISIQRAGAPELKLSAAVTKVEDSSFESGDQIGVYMEYPEGYALDNRKYTLNANGSWVTGSQHWWKDETTPADFYCYHPYKSLDPDAQTVEFSVAKDQTTHEAFSGSDILWGSKLQVKPTEGTVELMTGHLNGQIIIELIPGTGYDSTSLSRAIEQVHFNNVLTDAVLNLKSCEYRSTGSSTDIIPQREGLTLRALLPPQSIDNALLMTITVDGLDRTLTASVEIESNIKKKCRVTINKVSEGINVGIGGWEDSNQDFGGTLK